MVEKVSGLQSLTGSGLTRIGGFSAPNQLLGFGAASSGFDQLFQQSLTPNQAPRSLAPTAADSREAMARQSTGRALPPQSRRDDVRRDDVRRDSTQREDNRQVARESRPEPNSRRPESRSGAAPQDPARTTTARQNDSSQKASSAQRAAPGDKPGAVGSASAAEVDQAADQVAAQTQATGPNTEETAALKSAQIALAADEMTLAVGANGESGMVAIDGEEAVAESETELEQGTDFDALNLLQQAGATAQPNSGKELTDAPIDAADQIGLDDANTETSPIASTQAEQDVIANSYLDERGAPSVVTAGIVESVQFDVGADSLQAAESAQGGASVTQVQPSRVSTLNGLDEQLQAVVGSADDASDVLDATHTDADTLPGTSPQTESTLETELDTLAANERLAERVGQGQTGLNSLAAESDVANRTNAARSVAASFNTIAAAATTSDSGAEQQASEAASDASLEFADLGQTEQDALANTKPQELAAAKGGQAAQTSNVAQLTPVQERLANLSRLLNSGDKPTRVSETGKISPAATELSDSSRPLITTRFAEQFSRVSGENSRPAQLALPTPIYQREWAQELGQKMVMMVGTRIQSAQLHVRPENMGPIDVRISLQQDQATVVFNSPVAQTRDVLEQALPRLREMLDQNGVTLADVDVRDQSAQQQARQQSNAQADHRSAQRDTNSDVEELVSAEPNTTTITQSLPGLVDVHA